MKYFDKELPKYINVEGKVTNDIQVGAFINHLLVDEKRGYIINDRILIDKFGTSTLDYQ